jgi:mono/diheme cytochrome c family protein
MQRRLRQALTLFTALAGQVSLVALLGAGGLTPVQDPRQIDAGRKIFDSEGCAKCHMIAGRGNRMFPLDGVGAKLSAADIRRWLTNTAEMEDALPKAPAIRMSTRKYDFNDAELAALVAYLESLKAKESGLRPHTR